jgi:tetratricopeptide (TPR) repeat protein
MPALKAYADGAALALDGKSREAISLLQRATDIDNRFALAEEKLGLLQFSVGEAAEATAHLTRAHQLRDLANPYDRFLIEAHYNNLVTGDLSAALRIAREAVESYPASAEFLLNLAGLEDKTGKSALALDPARRAIALDPDNPAGYQILAASQMHLGQFDEAVLTCRRAISRAIDTTAIRSLLLQVAFQRLDQSGVEEQIAWVQGKPEEAAILVDQAWMELAQGRASSAQRLFGHAFTSLRQQGAVENANLLEAAFARRLAELGFMDAAEAHITHLPHPADYPDAASAWAEIGETSRASSLLAEALAAHPSSSLLQQLQAPEVRAAIALNQHNPQQALEVLQPTQYDRASFDPPLLRGRALLALHRPQEAETQFHIILDHPGIDPLSQDYPLAQLGLGRALAAEGKLTEAGFPYKIVLQIWKDADSDLPRLHDARAEYDRLNGAPAPVPVKPRRR